MRRLLFWAVVAGAVWFLASHLADIAVFLRALLEASPGWLVVAALLQAAYFTLYAAAYRQAFIVVDVPRPLLQLVPAVLAALFVNVVTPTGGTAGPALIIDDAVQHGFSGARAATATLLAQAAVFLGHAVAIVPGMVVLALAGHLRPYQGFAFGVLALIVAAHVAAFALAIRRPRALEAVLLGLKEAAERASEAVRHPIDIGEEWATRTAEDIRTAALLVVRRPIGSARVLTLVVAGYAFDLASLYAVALAFGLRLGALGVLAAYAVGKLFWIVSPVPQGIGVVEGTMTLALASFGATAQLAGAIALTFRGLGFWLPFVIGMVLLRATGSFRPRAQSSVPSE